MTRKRTIVTKMERSIHVEKPQPEPVVPAPAPTSAPSAEPVPVPAPVGGDPNLPWAPAYTFVGGDLAQPARPTGDSDQVAQSLKDMIEQAHKKKMSGQIGIGVSPGWVKDKIDRSYGAISQSEFSKMVQEKQAKLMEDLAKELHKGAVFGTLGGDFPLQGSMSNPPGYKIGQRSPMAKAPVPAVQMNVVPQMLPKVIVDPNVPKGEFYMVGNDAVLINVHDYEEVDSMLKDGLQPAE